jgi:hypothetical protein
LCLVYISLDLEPLPSYLGNYFQSHFQSQIMSSTTAITSTSVTQAVQRRAALAKLRESLDINLLYSLLSLFSLGRFTVVIDALHSHPDQRVVDNNWVQELVNHFEQSTPLDHQHPGLAIADQIDWPQAGLEVAAHPFDEGTQTLMQATVIEGQHRIKAKALWVKKFKLDNVKDKVWTFHIYHKGV